MQVIIVELSPYIGSNSKTNFRYLTIRKTIALNAYRFSLWYFCPYLEAIKVLSGKHNVFHSNNIDVVTFIVTIIVYIALHVLLIEDCFALNQANIIRCYASS